jgi:cytochrome P450
MEDLRDPFRKQRLESGIEHMQAEGQDFPLILRLQDLRKACKDWATFSSDDPFMIVPHSEADVRTVRQYPLEVDPPAHADYRAIVEPFFALANDPEYQPGIDKLVHDALGFAFDKDSVEVVREVLIPIQSRALAKLLNVDDAEADVWIGWGTHIFKDGDGVSKGADVERYTSQKFADSTDPDADDFFSVLNRAELKGRKLTLEEKNGMANLAFAGGRDTIIHTLSSIIEYFGNHPDQLEFLREDESRLSTAAEEFVRFVSPSTALARKCPHGAQVLDVEVSPGGRVGLCWPSANRDETVFSNPEQVVLDRYPNPHVGFGFGIHRCLGAQHARVVIRSFLTFLTTRIKAISILESVPQIETESSFNRQVGYERLVVSFATI